MVIRAVIVGLIVAASAVAASSTVSRVGPGRTRMPVTPGTAPLHAYGSRGSAVAQHPLRKLDGTLAELTRHASQARASHLLADLRSMSPAAHFKLAADGSTPMVSVDATTTGDPLKLRAALEALGLERAAAYSNDVGGWLPIAQLGAAAARSEVHGIRAALSRTRSGAVASQGDFVIGSALLRTADSLSGAGITVGVLSDSFDCYAVYAAPGSGVPVSGYSGYAPNGFTATAAADEATGDLPATVDVIEEADCPNYGAPEQPPFSDEGRAMLQIVHDVAPAASLAFYTADRSEADFAAGIGKLAAAGAKIIADDVGYYDEPFFQDGIVAQAIDAAEADGVAYFSAAGNDGNAANANGAYENAAPKFTTRAATGGTNGGELLLDFDPTGVNPSTTLPVTLDALQPGEFVAVVIEWDQPYVTGAPASGGATSQLDACVTGSTSLLTILDYDGNPVTCTGANAVGSDPNQILIIGNPANAAGSTPKETLLLSIGLAGGAAPGRIKVIIETDGQADPPLTMFVNTSPTLQGHPGAAGAMAVGAAFYFNTPACGTAPALLESYSSSGGDPILFDVTGTRLSAPQYRQKPDVVGPDGINDTFLGFTLAAGGYTGSNGLLTTSIGGCQNAPTYPNFFGTSAATPHVASLAALLLEKNPALTPAELYAALRSSALPLSAAVVDFDSGYGFVQAPQAAAAPLPSAPLVPTLVASAASVDEGQPITLTWASGSSTGCSASGAWGGALAASGSLAVTPTAPATLTYDLACSNAQGTSPTASLTVEVLAVPPPLPSLTVAPASVTVGTAATLTWASSVIATGCTASNGWSGALATSGTQTVVPKVAGTSTYVLTCADSAGNSQPASVSLIATPAPATGGGGGVDGAILVELAGVALWVRSTRRIGRRDLRRAIGLRLTGRVGMDRDR